MAKKKEYPGGFRMTPEEVNKDWIDMTYEERIDYANNPPADKVPKIEARLEPDPAWPERWRCSCCGLGGPKQTALHWDYCPYCHSKFATEGGA